MMTSNGGASGADVAAIRSCFVLTSKEQRANIIFAAGQGLRIVFATSGAAVRSVGAFE
jgi:hypothetical protein